LAVGGSVCCFAVAASPFGTACLRAVGRDSRDGVPETPQQLLRPIV